MAMNLKLKKMQTPDSPNCPKFLSNLDRMVDGNMSPEEEQEFIDSLQPSLECLEKMHIQKAYKEFLVQKLERKRCSQDLIASIRNTIAVD